MTIYYMYYVYLLFFIGLFSGVVYVLFRLRRKLDPTLKRIKDLDEENNKNWKQKKVEALKKRKEKAYKTIEDALQKFSRISKQDEQKLSKLQKSLVQAGYNREDSIKIFIGIKMVSAVAFFLLYFYLGIAGDRPIAIILLMASFMTLLGYRFPDIFLIFKVRKRKEIIARALPDALDLLVISVEAGLGLNAAINRVGGDLKVRCPPLSVELNRVNHELRTGIPRETALRRLSERNDIEDLKIFVGALILADRLGTSIADTLRAQADSLRTRIKQKAEEQAAKAGVKLLFPLVMFILPALILILMGPGLISVFRTFQ